MVLPVRMMSVASLDYGKTTCTPKIRLAVDSQRESMERVKASIREHGMVNPLIVHGTRVLVGNQRLWAARELGIDEVPCILVSDPNTQMTEARESYQPVEGF